MRSEWPELTPDLLLRVVEVLFHPREKAETELVTVLSDLPPALLVRLEAWQFRELMDLTRWVWEKPLVEPIFGSIEHNGLSYALPAKDCSNVSVIEWHHAEGFMAAFQEGDVEALDKLAGCVIRLEKLRTDHYDVRVPFDPYRLDADTKAIADLDFRLKLYALWFVHGCRRNLVEQYPMLYDTTGETAAEQVYGFGNDEEVDFGWIGTAYQVAEQGVFGNFNEVLRTDIHTILYYLSWKKQEAERTQRQIEQSRSKGREA